MAAYSIYWFTKTTAFYYKNNWDFEVDFGPPIYRSEFHEPSEEVKRKTKYFFLIIIVVVSTILEIPILYSVTREFILG